LIFAKAVSLYRRIIYSTSIWEIKDTTKKAGEPNGSPAEYYQNVVRRMQGSEFYCPNN